MKILPIVLLIFLSIRTSSQTLEKIAAGIELEGKQLYRLEKASGISSDLFIQKFSRLQDSVQGYFSYEMPGRIICIFFTRSPVKARCTFYFDSLFKHPIIDSFSRPLTAQEMDLYIIRKKSLLEISNDSLFKTYSNTSFNLVPMIWENEKRVYVLSAFNLEGVLVFGNDYLLTFNDENNLVTKKAIHNGISFYNEPVKPGLGDKGSHSHADSSVLYITSTDICTLMLNERRASLKEHQVVSAKFVSTWDCIHDKLRIVTREEWNKKQKTVGK